MAGAPRRPHATASDAPATHAFGAMPLPLPLPRPSPSPPPPTAHARPRAGPGSSFPSRILSDSERPLLLVLDRSFDPLSPLLHEFTYQAMVHDLLSVHDDRYEYHYVTNNNAQASHAARRAAPLLAAVSCT